ncbi:uncharacterized protein [Pleurodeles waltl]|uniref:uncharacterized protein isoform X2 n=1 Tax=Pleurodeles waltl TaxID=8319 RepID=UPI0037096AB9
MAARPRLCGAVESHCLLGVEAAPLTDEAEREEKLWPGFGSQYRTALLGLFCQRLQLEPRHLLLCLGQDVAAVAAALRSTYNLRQPPVLWDEEEVQQPLYQRALLLHPTHDHHQNVIGLVRQIFSGLEDLGEMLLVHRPGSMITLPFFEKARKKLAEEDYPYMKVLECLSELGADVQWEIEHVPVITSKANWLSVVGRKGPPMPRMLSPHEVESGLEELRHGCLRYIARFNFNLD